VGVDVREVGAAPLGATVKLLGMAAASSFPPPFPLSSGAPSRRACDVFSLALMLPTSFQDPALFLLRKRPPFFRVVRTMSLAMLGFSLRWHEMYRRW